MDKKKIYIAVIVICLLASAGILYWSSQDQSAALPEGIAPINTDIDRNEETSAPQVSVDGIPRINAVTEYTAPRVFPSDTKLDLSVYSSQQFRNLNDYTPLQVAPEQIGRENPFINY